MGNFLRENWLWIVTPIVLLVIALAVVVMNLGTSDDGQFIYNIF
jgi:hypothetical protein